MQLRGDEGVRWSGGVSNGSLIGVLGRLCLVRYVMRYDHTGRAGRVRTVLVLLPKTVIHALCKYQSRVQARFSQQCYALPSYPPTCTSSLSIVHLPPHVMPPSPARRDVSRADSETCPVARRMDAHPYVPHGPVTSHGGTLYGSHDVTASHVHAVSSPIPRFSSGCEKSGLLPGK